MKTNEFEELLKSIDQARAIKKGAAKPSRTFQYAPMKVKEIRANLKMTQTAFASMLCVSLATLRNWEQGRTYPEGAAIALLRVVEAEPESVLKALHAA